jgi:hypothetical protein
MPVTIQIQKPVNMLKLIKELAAAGFFATSSQPGVFITVEDSDNTSAVTAVYDAHDPNPTAAEIATVERKDGARTIAVNTNGWFTWTVVQMLSWAQTNIGTPLADGRTNLPTTLTLASARAAFIVLLNILDKMLVMQIAMAKMIIAFRDDKWPEQ